MTILDNVIQKSVKIHHLLWNQKSTNRDYQYRTLYKLLLKARSTKFGKHYKFIDFYNTANFIKEFQQNVPYHNYDSMFDGWWQRSYDGEKNIAWPGKVKYFALSSGTSGSASKHIPVTRDMIKQVKQVGLQQLLSLDNFDVNPQVYHKDILMLGGSTKLMQTGEVLEGDMSGISQRKIPKWVKFMFYKPGKLISKRPLWEDRIKLIVRKAPTWNVATICGVPAWVQIVLEQVIAYHKVQNIHEVWPNFQLYIHGGVSFEPYRESFEKLLGKPINFIETYMASEGSFGFQARPNTNGIKLALKYNIFFEFVPFTTENFTEDGDILQTAKAQLINEVQENIDYAVVITTCAGAWRYLIGDVVQFTNTKLAELKIVGRTKQFLSLCGEHISIDNLNQAVQLTQKELNICIKEYTVFGEPHQNRFAHHWYIGTDDCSYSETQIAQTIDKHLCILNDDYAVERKSALPYLFVHKISNNVFINYLESQGKVGGMVKFPRVLKGDKIMDWKNYLLQM
jgi:GH3 auxin-responsive promoter